MPDHMSLMLDSMILAVDQGFSYDGIVSIPEIGLEDVGYRARPAGFKLLNDCVELVWTTRAAISRVAARFFPKAAPPREAHTSIIAQPQDSSAPEEGDDGSAQAPRSPSTTEGLPGAEPQPRLRAKEPLPSERGEEVPRTGPQVPCSPSTTEGWPGTEHQPRLRPQEPMPSRTSEHVSISNPKSPRIRRKGEEVVGDITHPDQDQEPRKREGVNDQNARDPRKMV